MEREILLLSALMVSTFCASADEVACRMVGSVTGRPESKELVLIKSSKDPRFDGVKIEIKYGRFDYELTSEVEQLYSLIFAEELERGAFGPVLFCAENGTVSFELGHDKQIVSGGRENMAIKAILMN